MPTESEIVPRRTFSSTNISKSSLQVMGAYLEDQQEGSTKLLEITNQRSVETQDSFYIIELNYILTFTDTKKDCRESLDSQITS
ncbi:hypothetical protein [Halobacillus halophilus]|uniref:hypothetical protein n=1 Tax=Halobacillus halophilus TaxID=1570 RepID=UPI001CD41F44|nr:hypothetical protein [Halobacillus halophilus]MCA1013035.1 hypothetical protein [Halobacillus halophilus]